MYNRYQKKLYQRFLPGWLVLMADFAIVICTFIFTYLLRFNLFANSANLSMLLEQLIIAGSLFLVGAMIFKPQRHIIRHTTLNDAISVLKTHLVLTTGLLIARTIIPLLGFKLIIPVSVIIIQFFLSVTLMVVMRYLIKFIFHNIFEQPKNGIPVMVYGAGKLGSMIQTIINNETNLNYKIVGFVDDNPALWNSRLGGVRIYSPAKTFTHLIRSLDVKEMILAISAAKLEIETKREIVDACLAANLKVREVPDPSTWLDKKQAGQMIRNVKIEDLLGRDPISINVEKVSKGIDGKQVMITGGAGSIGSEIVRQLLFLKPKSIVIVDQAESDLFEIQNEVLPELNGIQLTIFVADVTDRFKMKRIFDRCRPEIIFHAAAYKHVPMMELQPYEAINNNVGGTKVLADLAVEYEVEKFVMVSTDKAVNPTNIMGASKRICEIYIQSLANRKDIKTQFITTRFGNVLGSNGSVIPIFKNQISKGGPVTVTHKDVIRYFMTIPEACQLVLEAGFLGKGGEIFLFDMGEPVRIYDLAKKMISLSGYTPNSDIHIVEVGLRPGEKLYEELLADKEVTLPTSNKRIMIANIRPYQYRKAIQAIDLMLENLFEMDDYRLVYTMKEIVPEFISSNSRFESLDIKSYEMQVV
jgi:FlaA1/EpsC-like NDP-sugar epimerase